MITHLEPHQVFVFGSNLAGKHLSGAARQAIEEFGAEWGVGEGLTGQCYAFPTLTEEFEQLSDEALEEAVGFFVYTAYVHSEYEFLLTKVGCGIAGFEEEKMRKLFENVPTNVIKPEGW